MIKIETTKISRFYYHNLWHYFNWFICLLIENRNIIIPSIFESFPFIKSTKAHGGFIVEQNSRADHNQGLGWHGNLKIKSNPYLFHAPCWSFVHNSIVSQKNNFIFSTGITFPSVHVTHFTTQSVDNEYKRPTLYVC